MPDAVVIGAGPNGLVAANLLADEGWDVQVLEAQPEPGGAVRSGELTLPGFVHDRFSSFYPLGLASPVMRGLELEEHGLKWRHSEVALAHPASDGTEAHIAAGIEATAAALDRSTPGDGESWRRLMALYERVGGELLDALLSPFPPVRAAARLAARLRPAGTLDFARFGLLPVRRLAEEAFRGEAPARLLAGNALHSDLGPEQPGSGLYGWMLCGLAQTVGFPVVEGGSSGLTSALVRRLEGCGGAVACNARVTEVVVRRGRAVAVRTGDGREVDARRAVLADVDAPRLLLDLVPRDAVPDRVLRALDRFEHGFGTFKMDWALDGPIPWLAEETAGAGTVHIGEGLDALSEQVHQLVLRRLPARPFLVAGQYARADPTRMPPGREILWAYAHVPQRIEGDAGPGGLTGKWQDEREREAFADRIEQQVERVAPGFRNTVLDRHIATPSDLEAQNSNLVGGAYNGGTAQLHQQLVLRPIPGLGRAETPVAGLYLASASAHPGGGVHGACGANAARAALREPGPVRRAAARLAGAVAGDGRERRSRVRAPG